LEEKEEKEMEKEYQESIETNTRRKKWKKILKKKGFMYCKVFKFTNVFNLG
jgi:hypothetical protein